MTTVAEALTQARLLIAKSWNPDGPYRPPTKEEAEADGSVRKACGWNHPDAREWCLDAALRRCAGGDIGLMHRASEVLDKLLEPAVSDSAERWRADMVAEGDMRAGSPGDPLWQGALAATWEREPGRTQADMLRLLGKACARAVKQEAA